MGHETVLVEEYVLGYLDGGPTENQKSGFFSTAILLNAGVCFLFSHRWNKWGLVVYSSYGVVCD